MITEKIRMNTKRACFEIQSKHALKIFYLTISISSSIPNSLRIIISITIWYCMFPVLAPFLDLNHIPLVYSMMFALYLQHHFLQHFRKCMPFHLFSNNPCISFIIINCQASYSNFCPRCFTRRAKF